MKINIIDARNQCLDGALAQFDAPLVSTILPSPHHPLPLEIESVLALSLSQPHHPMAISIMVELNQWMKKDEALTLLQHTRELIQQFYLKSKTALPIFDLAIYENEAFTAIELDNQHGATL